MLAYLWIWAIVIFVMSWQSCKGMEAVQLILRVWRGLLYHRWTLGLEWIHLGTILEMETRVYQPILTLIRKLEACGNQVGIFSSRRPGPIQGRAQSLQQSGKDQQAEYRQYMGTGWRILTGTQSVSRNMGSLCLSLVRRVPSRPASPLRERILINKGPHPIWSPAMEAHESTLKVVKGLFRFVFLTSSP